MDEGQGQERTQLSDDPDQAAAQLRSEIQDVRENLGDTVEELAAKTDVKTRARAKADELKRSATERFSSKTAADGASSGVAAGASSGLARVRSTARENPVPTAALGALIGGFLIGRLTRREP